MTTRAAAAVTALAAGPAAVAAHAADVAGTASAAGSAAVAAHAAADLTNCHTP